MMKVPLIAALPLLALAASGCAESGQQPVAESVASDQRTSQTATDGSRGLSEEPPWKLVITRADGTVETVGSLDEPIICGSEDEPRILYFCGTSAVEGQSLPVAWDFRPVNIGAGDSYRIEGPPTPTGSEARSPTPTVIGQ